MNTSLNFLRKQKKIQVLPVMYRSVIVLRYFEDLKIEEIAEWKYQFQIELDFIVTKALKQKKKNIITTSGLLRRVQL
ncbi:hypothetical protein J2Z65_004623 [Paenibacillus aceris]|uniref:RNA polymerase sigma factor 70 region 4 type 2 domain-containing protein n=1 Tax=Paenibacillus aceris TaxID=869555 RepID=A0ABS4I385_9BACL|nr:hypothetical protein [Paenibacillus aceris]